MAFNSPIFNKIMNISQSEGSALASSSHLRNIQQPQQLSEVKPVNKLPPGPQASPVDSNSGSFGDDTPYAGANIKHEYNSIKSSSGSIDMLGGVSMKGTRQQIVSAAAPVFEKYNLTIHSGGANRTKVGNGAKRSQHLHGNALDVNVSGMSIPKRQELIMEFRKQGFTGFGVGRNTLHVDMGNRRSWGYAGGKASGSGPAPSWAQGPLNARISRSKY